MFKWSVLLLLCGKVLCVNNQTLKYAEKRVFNGAGMDYAFHQQLAASEQSQGLSAYSSFVQKMPDQPGEIPKNVRTIIVTKKVPVPYPVQVEKKVPVPVKIPIRRPYTVYVPRPYYVEVMKQVPVPVKVSVPQPYTVEKHVPFPFKVHYDKPFPVHITKPYPVYYEKRVPIHVEKPVAVPYKVHVDRPMPVNIPMERPVYFPVERPYHFPVKVPVDKPVLTHVHQPVPVPVTVEKPHIASEQSRIQDFYSSTQPTVHNTFSPSPYDELTSTMLTEGKHKVISFLPGSQTTFGSYGSSSADIGTIHVSSIKGNGGNSTDWVPKEIPNNQYLTYIPNSQHKYPQYKVPERDTKPQEVHNAEPYVVKHGSVRMHYKLHFDPIKQEYSFQLVPKSQNNQFGRHTGYSYQSDNGQSNQEQSSPPTEYVYKTSAVQDSGSIFQFPTKSQEDAYDSYHRSYQNKAETHSAQQSSDSPALTYYPSEEQSQQQYKQEPQPYAFQTIDSGSTPSYDTNSQVTAGKIPEVTYSYQQTQSMDSKPQIEQLSSNPHQVTYTYETVGGDGLRFEPHLKHSEKYPTEHVRYMYIPQSHVSHSNSGSFETSNGEAQYSIPSEQNGFSTEYPQILYQQGRIATILREHYVTPVPQSDSDGRIPENFKSSRTSESVSYFHDNNDTLSSSGASNDRDDQHVIGIPAASATDNYQIHNIHPTSYNQTNEESPTSSIKFEKFGVADVMSSVRTKLYPVNESAGSQSQNDVDFSESSSSTSGYGGETPLEHYFLDNGKSLEVTEGPFNAKVYRLSTYKVPRSRRVTRTKLKKSNDLDLSQDQTDHSEADSEKTTTSSSMDWYEFFGSSESKYQKNVAKETNSHTGAAERAPYGITSTATTTSSNSLQPTDETITIKPTQSLRTRSRGSVKAYTKRKEESTTEGNLTTTTARTRRRRRPARRRMDKATESPVEETIPRFFPASV